MTIEECLKDLGERTASEIRDLLVKEGIKGGHSFYNCPIQQYILKKTGYNTMVDTTSLTTDLRLRYKLPEIVRDFIYQFDGGKYKELEEC